MTTQTQSGFSKFVTIVGFILTIILAVWLAVKIVAFIPSAFSSLASIADGVYNERPQSQITIAQPDSIANSGKTVTVNWADVNRAGVYTFSYECIDGVSIDIRYPANQITPVACDEIVELGTDTTSLQIMARSEARRFVDVVYTIGFIKAETTGLAYSNTATFTVVNANIPQSQTLAQDDADEMDDSDDMTDTTSEPAEPTEVAPEPATPAVTTQTQPIQYRYVERKVYELPKSDPNGFVDLSVKYLGVGVLNSNNEFIATNTLDNDERGAFRFSVHNLGTKTSNDWDFEATLTSGQRFSSKTQAGLKPNERSIITVGFDSVGSTGTKLFRAEVDVDNDINSYNDFFIWSVQVRD